METREPEVKFWMGEDRTSNWGTKNTNAAKKKNIVQTQIFKIEMATYSRF